MDHFLSSILGDKTTRHFQTQTRELAGLLRRFYDKHNPSKRDSSESLAASFVTNLPLLSQKLLATYGADLCCVLDNKSKLF